MHFGHYLDPPVTMVEAEVPVVTPGGGSNVVRTFMGVLTPMSTIFQAAVTDSLLWVGNGETYSFDVYDASGSLHSIVRLDRPGAPVTDDVRDEYRTWMLERDTSTAFRERQQAILDHTRWPETMGAYNALHEDPVGRMWVREYQPPWIPGMPTWRIFDAAGQQVATAVLPIQVTVHGIGEDYVLGRWVGEMGVPHIGKFRIRRPARQ